MARELSRIGGRVAWALDPALDVPLPEQARAVVEGLLLGAYDPGRLKSGERRKAPDALVLLTDEDAEAVQEAAERAVVVAGWANRARDLANEPPNSLTPAALAAHAESFAAGSEHLDAEALGPDEIAELGMGAFAGVAAGSHNPAAPDRHALRPAGRVRRTSSSAWSARRSRSTRAASRSSRRSTWRT